MPREISGIRPLPGVTLSPFLAVRPAPWLPSGPLRLYTGANEENVGHDLPDCVCTGPAGGPDARNACRCRGAVGTGFRDSIRAAAAGSEGRSQGGAEGSGARRRSGRTGCARAPPGPAEAQVPPLIYSNWTKICGKGPEAGSKQVCQTGKDGRLESGMPVVAAVVIEMEGEAKKVLQVTLPPGVLLPRGTRVVIDRDEPSAIIGSFLVCANGGCIAQLEATAETVAKLKKGQNLYRAGLQHGAERHDAVAAARRFRQGL